MTQCACILQHLRTIGPITPLDALQAYGCFRLGARILEPKKQGHNIATERFKTNSGKVVARYRLHDGGLF